MDYVSTTVGPEQEYFLIKKEDYEARQDLILTGRTLFGAPSAKGQELEEHYFGVIRPEVSAFMKELDEELWKLGVPAKTKHNEVAPCQHELAPIFDTTNVAIDHNLLTMEMMKKLAPKYGLVCLQPVSYTHLYRKTVLEPADLSACRVIFGEADQFPGLTVDRFNNILAVSYTHLDVYKRQRSGTRWRPVPPRCRRDLPGNTGP